MTLTEVVNQDKPFTRQRALDMLGTPCWYRNGSFGIELISEPGKPIFLSKEDVNAADWVIQGANDNSIMKVGSKVFVRDGWINEDYMVWQGEIIDIGYEKGTGVGKVYLVEFGNCKSVWFHRIALKTQ